MIRIIFDWYEQALGRPGAGQAAPRNLGQRCPVAAESPRPWCTLQPKMLPHTAEAPVRMPAEAPAHSPKDLRMCPALR